MTINVDPQRTLRERLRDKVAELLKNSRGVVFSRSSSEAVLNLVVREFTFKSGATKSVKLQAEAMAAFEKALMLCPSLEVTVDYRSMYSGSFRSHSQQQALRTAYLNGTGHLAAPVNTSWHEAGLAVDILDPDVNKPNENMTPRQALHAVGFVSYLPADPPHQSYRVDTRTNKTFVQPGWVKKAKVQHVLSSH